MLVKLSKVSQRNPLLKPIKGLYFMEMLSSTEWSNNQSNLSFNPNIFIDISSSIDKKIKSLSFYKNVRETSSSSLRFCHKISINI